MELENRKSRPHRFIIRFSVCSSYIILLLFVCSCATDQQKNETSCYYIVPSDTINSTRGNCSSQSKCPCHTLTHYIDTGAFNKSYSKFYFFSGHHILDKVVEVTSKPYLTNLTLIPISSEACTSTSPKAIIKCIGKSAGFMFSNVSNLTIVGLGFHNCGFVTYYLYNFSVALILHNASDFYICDVEISSSSGWGLFLRSVYGRSHINNTYIHGSHNVSNNNNNYTGGNLYLDYREDVPSSQINITNCKIKGGNFNDGPYYYGYGGGIRIYLQTNSTVDIRIEDVQFIENCAEKGGNVAVHYESLYGTWPSSVSFVNCNFTQGSAHLGGGIYIIMGSNSYSSYASVINPFAVSMINCHIQNNSAQQVGGGVYLQIHENIMISALANIYFQGCTFDSNINLKTNYSRGGTAVNLINFHIPGFANHMSPQYQVSFVSCNFTNNEGIVNYDDSVGSGTLYTEENALTILKDCLFLNNMCTGVTAVHSNIVLQGNITLQNNTGYNGGGMVMCANSVLYMDLNTPVYVLIKNCHANNFGGGIYAEFECSQAIPPCFFQVSDSTRITHSLIHLHNNTAKKAGDAIYGGAVDKCYAFGPYNRSNKTNVFNDLFYIRPVNNNSISSNPIKVCFCIENVRDCNVTHNDIGSIYPGGTLSLSLVIVGQRNGTVPGIVILSPEHTELKPQQNTNDTDPKCKTLNYTIMAAQSIGNENIKLTVGNSDFRNGLIDDYNNVSVTVSIEECPFGFSIYQATKQCECAEWVQSLKTVTCDIVKKTILRKSNSTWWIGVINSTHSMTNNINNTAVYAHFCPFDYCIRKDKELYVTEDFQDHQCANQRKGTLCGSCKQSHSVVLGSTRCLSCNKRNLVVRSLGLVLFFAVLGVVLVVVMGVLNITVSEGTLNAIVFYMNVVKVNSSIFYTSLPVLGPMIDVFVAWMNLDWGIETCFFNGMDAVGKAALQFVFPLYLFCLSALMIYLSRRSLLITRIFGKNVVKILATIIFHFYAKIIRTIIDILRSTLLNNVNSESKLVWTIDGTVQYMHNKHTVLFAFAVIVTAVTLPYTLALLFIQCLRKRSDMRILFWVNKLKPFFDAYTGPYKNKYHFWTGFLLMIRLFLFVGIATNTNYGEILNITLIIVTTSLLLVFIQPGIYKSCVLNIVEAFTYANLTVLAAFTGYSLMFNYRNDINVIICIGSMFLLFCGVIVYHVIIKLSETQKWRLVKVWLLDKKWPWMKRKPIRSLILPYIDPDNCADVSSSDDELEPIPPVARYDEYREPLIGTQEHD